MTLLIRFVDFRRFTSAHETEQVRPSRFAVEMTTNKGNTASSIMLLITRKTGLRNKKSKKSCFNLQKYNKMKTIMIAKVAVIVLTQLKQFPDFHQ